MSISTRLKNVLDENHISYRTMAHTTAYTAQGAAATMKISGKELAKSVVVRAGENTLLAVLPAAHHASLEKLGGLLGKPVRLATEEEFGNLFPDCELGAMPPFGELYGLPVYVDDAGMRIQPDESKRKANQELAASLRDSVGQEELEILR